MTEPRDSQDLARKNRRVLVVSLLVVFGMVGMSFASVPLYRAFCKVTGWSGTTRQIAANPNKPLAGHTVTVRFDSNVARGMPWHFKPEVREITLPVGADGMVSYVAENPTDQTITGTALYNVTPLQVGKYFNKTQCFCFGEQVLNPHQKVHMPVVFFVDPAFATDPDMKGIKTITLSYTFFKAASPELDRAVNDYINKDDKKAGG